MMYVLKISIIGDEFTGKTSIITRHLSGTFLDGYRTTLGANFMNKTYTHEDLEFLKEGDRIDLTIWDMAGQQHFLELVKIYYEGSHGFIIVFDITNPSSFENVKEKWFKFIQKCEEGVKVLIVGNKTDLEGSIALEKIEQLKAELNCEVILTSAKENQNIEQAFKTIIKDILEQ